MNDDEENRLAEFRRKVRDNYEAFWPGESAEAFPDLAGPLPLVGTGSMVGLRGLSKRIDQYFNTVSDEQLTEDLRRADFEHYNKIGAPILPPTEAQPNIGGQRRAELARPKSQPQ